MLLCYSLFPQLTIEASSKMEKNMIFFTTGSKFSICSSENTSVTFFFLINHTISNRPRQFKPNFRSEVTLFALYNNWKC